MIQATKKTVVKRRTQPHAPPEGVQFYTRPQAAFVLGVSVRQLDRLAMDGGGPPFVRMTESPRLVPVKDHSGKVVGRVHRAGGPVRYPKAELLKWAAARIVNPLPR
jgi:hypothetical protein